MMSLEEIWNPKAMLGYPIHHLRQVGSVSFLQKGLCREDMCAQHYVVRWNYGYYMCKTCYVVCPPGFCFQTVGWLLSCWEHSLSDQVGPCHSEIMNHPYSLFPFWHQQSILEISAGKFFYRFVCPVFILLCTCWQFSSLCNRWLQWRDPNLLISNFNLDSLLSPPLLVAITSLLNKDSSPLFV